MARPRVFVSYRRTDVPELTGRLRDRLVTRFGADRVFIDFDSIEPGADFRTTLADAVRGADVFLAMIGPRWLQPLDGADEPRLWSDGDYVRTEVEEAVRSQIDVIPVLVDGATMPAASELPESIRDLVYLNAARLRNDPDFRSDADRLLDRVAGRSTGPTRRAVVLRAGAAFGACAALIASLALLANDSADDDGDVPAATDAGAATSTPAATTTVTTTLAPVTTTSAPVTTTSTATVAPVATEPAADASTSATDEGTSSGELVLENQLGRASFFYWGDRDWTVSATSESPADGSGSFYGATNVVDGRLDSGWQPEPPGLDRALVFTATDTGAFAAGREVEIIDVYPGWQSAQPCLFERHARPSEVVVDAEATPEPDFGDLFVPVHTATSTALVQEDGRPLLRVHLPPTRYDRITITVTEVVAGESCDGDPPFDDLLISEVQLAAYDQCSFPDDFVGLDDVAGYDTSRYNWGTYRRWIPEGYVEPDQGDVGC